MAKSKIVLTFANWTSGNPTGTIVYWEHNGGSKSETAVITRTNSFQFNVAGSNMEAASNFEEACLADFSGLYTVSRVGAIVTLTAIADNVVFANFSCSQATRVTASITNEVVATPMVLNGYGVGVAPSNPCTTVQVTISQLYGTGPFEWVTPSPGTVGLTAILPRTGVEIPVTIEDSLGAQASINVPTPATFDNTAINTIQITGDPSGLYGSVSVFMNALASVLPIEYTYSMDNVVYQVGNTFTSVLPGLYTMYIRDNYGCTISQTFEVTLATTRPPVYRNIPKSNSFGWFERQAAVQDCVNPYNTGNAKPNDWKPTRWLNPRYFQPWCSTDNITTQFRSNYDTREAKLWDIVNEVYLDTVLEIVKMSDNIGQRQVMDAKIYDKTGGQTGVYWLTGNIYDTDGSTVIGTYDLNGQLPEWVKVGQKFFLSGSTGDGLYEIQQVIFDSLLLVNAAVINRIYTDSTDPASVKVDATYNRLNYEVYEFITPLSGLTNGCYYVELSMTDSLEEYPDSIWETLPFRVVNANRDLIYIESSDHVDDGIDYSTGIIHKQRFQGLFYEEDFPSTYETSRDSRKQLNKLDGRVEHTVIVEAIDVPYWVHEKLALFISKKSITINKLTVQFAEPFERERSNTYSRINLKAEATVSGYEQYMTNAYDIL